MTSNRWIPIPMFDKPADNIIERLDAFGGEAFRKAFIRWLGEANKVSHEPLVFTLGKKYIRLVCNGSAYGFIDKDGNVLKAATWSRPAKRAYGTYFCGSVYNEDKPADGAGKWGVLYAEEAE